MRWATGAHLIIFLCFVVLLLGNTRHEPYERTGLRSSAAWYDNAGTPTVTISSTAKPVPASAWAVGDERASSDPDNHWGLCDTVAVEAIIGFTDPGTENLLCFFTASVSLSSGGSEGDEILADLMIHTSDELESGTRFSGTSYATETTDEYTRVTVSGATTVSDGDCIGMTLLSSSATPTLTAKRRSIQVMCP